MGKLVWRVLSIAAPMVAALVAAKSAETLWRAIGNDRIDPEDPDSPIAKAVAFAAVTGLATGAARTFATRKAAQYYENSTGHLPADIEKRRATA